MFSEQNTRGRRNRQRTGDRYYDERNRWSIYPYEWSNPEDFHYQYGERYWQNEGQYHDYTGRGRGRPRPGNHDHRRGHYQTFSEPYYQQMGRSMNRFPQSYNNPVHASFNQRNESDRSRAKQTGKNDWSKKDKKDKLPLEMTQDKDITQKSEWDGYPDDFGWSSYPVEYNRDFGNLNQGNEGKQKTHTGKKTTHVKIEEEEERQLITKEDKDNAPKNKWDGYPDDHGWSDYPDEYNRDIGFLQQREEDKQKKLTDKKTPDKRNNTEDNHDKDCAGAQAPSQTPMKLDDKEIHTSNRNDQIAELVETLRLDCQEPEIVNKSARDVESGFFREVDSTSASLTLAWSLENCKMENIQNYEIKYKECNKNNSKWVSHVTNSNKKTCTVVDLKSGTEYEFKVRPIDTEGEEGAFSTPVVRFSTRMSLANTFLLDAKMVQDGSPKIYKLPLKTSKELTNPDCKSRICSLGTKNATFQEKNIMLVGATGSGKSTLIDAMINYITEVSWDDDYRFTLVDLTEDEKIKKDNQEMSQTEWITCYKIYHMPGCKIDYNLNIIDTPGFGDTRGIIRDKKIVEQIRHFFSSPGDMGISYIDAVCFVTQAPLARLTPPQRYIFDSILSVFGQDIVNNIYVLITFADGKEPPVLSSLKAANVPFEKSFNFNNSALFTNTENKEEAMFGKLFWKMGQESLRVFFDKLQLVESKSLQLTAEVLAVRQNLEATVQGLQPQIAEGLNTLNTIRQETEVLKRHKDEIACNKNFCYEVNEFRMMKQDTETGKYVTNCLSCNRTCHYPCRISDDEKKRKCKAMSHGICTVCPGECEWDMHVNNDFRYITYSVKVKKTYDDLKSKYEIAQKEERKQRSVIEKVKNVFTSVQNKVRNMMQDVRSHLNKLHDIALRPNPLTDIDYIDLMIESEKNEKKFGWQERIKLCIDIRKDAEIVAKTQDENFEPWGDSENILQEES